MFAWCYRSETPNAPRTKLPAPCDQNQAISAIIFRELLLDRSGGLSLLLRSGVEATLRVARGWVVLTNGGQEKKCVLCWIVDAR